MKLTSIKVFSLFIMLLFVFKAEAQIDKAENQNTDSIKYIIPEKSDADLEMIIPPVGFENSTLFNGYIHLQSSSSIIMTLIKNVNYLKICEGMTEEFFAKNKLIKISEGPIESDSRVLGFKYKFSFVLNGVDFIRYMVYAGDLNQTLWLNITYPVQVEGLVEKEILNSIQSINLNPSQDGEK